MFKLRFKRKKKLYLQFATFIIRPVKIHIDKRFMFEIASWKEKRVKKKKKLNKDFNNFYVSRNLCN